MKYIAVTSTTDVWDHIIFFPIIMTWPHRRSPISIYHTHTLKCAREQELARTYCTNFFLPWPDDTWKGHTVVSFMGVKLKHFRNILTFWNVDATQLRHRGALRDLGHPSEVQGAQAQGRESGCIILATPDKHSSIEAKIRRSPSISTMELLSFPIIARVLVRRTSKMIMLANQDPWAHPASWTRRQELW
jgi:hypothetical protein